MVEAGLLLQNSDFIPVHRMVVAPCVSRLHSFPVLLHSLTQAPACLAYICTKLGNLHMGPGTQLLPALLHVEVRSFGLTGSCLRVVLGRKETLNPSGVRTHCTASDRPCTYGRVTTGPRECSSAGLVGAGVA